MQSILHLVDDPLYRFALWVLVLQLFFMIVVTIFTLILKLIRPQLESTKIQEQKRAQRSLLQYLKNPNARVSLVTSLKWSTSPCLTHYCCRHWIRGSNGSE